MELRYILGVDYKQRRALEYAFYFLFLLATIFFVYWKGQDRNWDLLNYHFFQGYSVLNDRFNTDVAAAGLQSFLNPTANAVAYLALSYLPFPFSAWSILLIQLASVPAIVLLAKEIAIELGYQKALVPTMAAIALSLQAPLWWSELGTTFFSSWTAPLIIWGVYCLFRANQASNFSKAPIITAGLLFGLAVGIKLTNAPFAVSGFVMMAVMFFLSWRTFILGSTYFLLACSVGFLLTAWWNWHLWLTWGSPIFPLYNALFKSEYYDFVNFRDLRWHFASFHEFLTFILQAAWGTFKTSENLFADARYLFLALLIPLAFLCRRTTKLSTPLTAFISFMACSFLLWVLMFAYQRYLIPIELLLGLLIWIFVVRVFRTQWLSNLVMVGLNVCSLALIQVPDWGHAPTDLGAKNPFSIEMTQKLRATPARYVVVRAPSSPISYILPSFHAESIFYGIGFSKQVDDLINEKLSRPSSLPLRVLAFDGDAHLIPNVLKSKGYDPLERSLDCDYFRTGIGRYVVCEVYAQNRQSVAPGIAVNYDFTPDGYLNVEGILWEQGLSFFEPWGRWSDDNRVEFGLSNCLPQGPIKLTIEARAFGPNASLPFKVTLGNNQVTTEFSETVDQQSARFTNDAICLNKLTIEIPRPTSPKELGLSEDPRKLGLGFVSLKIERE